MTMDRNTLSHRIIPNLLLWVLPLIFLGVFYFLPLTSILKISLGQENLNILATLSNALESQLILDAIWFTFWQAFLSTSLTLLIGLPGAYLFARYEFRGKTFLKAITVIPFVIPTVVVAAAFYALIGPSGWINIGLMQVMNLEVPPIQITNTIYAILLAHVFYNTTIILRIVGDFWSHIDPRFNQAARILGANQMKAFLKVTFPILGPAIGAASLLVFLFNFTSFGIILILGGPKFATLEVEIYYQTISLFNLPLAAVLCIIQIFFTLAITVTYTRINRRLTLPLQLKSRTFTQKKFLTWSSRILASIVIFVLILLLVTPLFALAARSISRFEATTEAGSSTISNITLDYYRQLALNQQDSMFFVPPTIAIRNSLLFASLVVIVALIIGLPAAWALSYHSELWINRILDPLLMLPLGTSAVTLGLGFIVTLNQPPFDLRASPILIPIVHTLVAFPFVVRSLTPSLRSIKPQLRSAAAVLGASPLAVLRTIDLPLVGRAILVAATFAFTISLGEFGATALVSRPEYPTMPLMIYRFISRPGALNYGQAMAMSTILMVVTTVAIILIERIRIADIGEF